MLNEQIELFGYWSSSFIVIVLVPKSEPQFVGNIFNCVLDIKDAQDGPLYIVVVYDRPSGSAEVGSANVKSTPKEAVTTVGTVDVTNGALLVTVKINVFVTVNFVSLINTSIV